MKKQNKGFKKYLLSTACFLIPAACIIGFFLFYRQGADKRNDFRRIEQESYSGVFVSMYPYDYVADDFSYYRGVDVLKCTYEIRSLSDACDYLEAIFSTDNEITNIYLGLDSLEIWNSCRRSLSRWSKSVDELLAFAASHPEVRFEVLFSAPSLEYWAACSDDKTEVWITTCASLVDALCARQNFTCYFPGAKHWLIANPGNYLEPDVLNSEAAQTVMLYTLFTGGNPALEISPANANEVLVSLQTLITAQKEAPAEYADLSDLSIVFFGDSVIGNYQGSTSIPGVVSGLSGASVYNCATGGTTASGKPNNGVNFNATVELFLEGNVSAIPEKGPYRAALEQFLSGYKEDSQLCFFINYGLNDYFEGWPMENPDDKYDTGAFGGALRTGIKMLKAAYPDAEIILASPNYVTYFENGMEKKGEQGGILTDYVQTAENVAYEMNVLYYDTYTGLGFNASNANDYLVDGCHLNETGRFLFGTKIIGLLGNLQ